MNIDYFLLEMQEMLEHYLEKNIQNKLKLFNILYSKPSITIHDILYFLPLSINGIHSLIHELNIDLAGLAEIKRQVSGFTIIFYKKTTFMELLHIICQSSNVLQCLKFMILNEENQPLTSFIEERYLTKSSAYRIRETCGEYLHCIGLTRNGNQVIGEEYRIRFLIALLYYQFGIDCYAITRNDINLTRNFILSTNHSIDSNYSDTTENEYGFFECLFILLWKRKKFATESIVSKELEDCKSLFVYEKLKNALKAFEPKLNIMLSEYDYDYLYLVYCTTNNYLFADQWTTQDIKLLHKIVFSTPAFSDLLNRTEKRLGKVIANSPILKTALVYFYKKCILELQCIIPNKNFYLDATKSPITQLIYNTISDTMDDWRKSNHKKYAISDGHVFYMALQMEMIIKQSLKPVSVWVLSELRSELDIMTAYLKRLFPVERAEICPFCIGADQKEIICSQKQSVIIINKKFRYLIEKWNLSEDNTILLVTVELNKQELIDISTAIMQHEKENFFAFVRKISS